MSKYFNVTEPVQIEQTKDSAKIKYTISRINSSYFGYCNYYNCLAIQRVNNKGESYFYKYWGFPTASKWKSSWGTPSYNLSHEEYVANQYGELQGILFESQEFIDEIKIDRGNSRQGSKSVTVGVKAGNNTTSTFSTTLKTITVYTTSIPKATLNTFTVTADSNDIVDRYIHISGTYSNPENYFTARIYNNKTPGKYEYISKEGDTAFNFSIPITKDMYNTSQEYTVEIIGKDSVVDVTSVQKATVQPSGVGLAIKNENGSVHEVSTAYLWNVTTKNVPEVWIKMDDKIIKTIK